MYIVGLQTLNSLQAATCCKIYCGHNESYNTLLDVFLYQGQLWKRFQELTFGIFYVSEQKAISNQIKSRDLLLTHEMNAVLIIYPNFDQ